MLKGPVEINQASCSCLEASKSEDDNLEDSL